MANLAIEAIYRSDMSKSNKKEIRRQGYVTASIFGHDVEPVPVMVKLEDLVIQIREKGGSNALIDVKITGGPEKSDGTVIIKSFFKEPLSRKVLDIQFQRISMEEKLHVGVPIILFGDSPGVKDGGLLEQTLDELQVNCLPGSIPSKFELDVSGLSIGDHIRAGEVILPEGVEMLTDPDSLIANCMAPHVRRADEEADAATAAAASAASTAAAEAAAGPAAS